MGHLSLERGNAPCLLLDDGEQLDDHLAHDKRGLFPIGGIQRNPGWQWARSCRLIPQVILLEAL